MRGTHGRTARIRRSCLFVPGSSEKMLAKAPALGADEVIIDLEDAVVPGRKAAARALVAESLRTQDWGETTVSVRVNDAGSDWTLQDLESVLTATGSRLDAIMLPKVQTVQQIGFVDHAIRQICAAAGDDPDRVGLEVQIEDAVGLVNLRAILGASARIEAVTLGPGDMAADLRMPTLTVGAPAPDYPGDQWHAIRSTLLVEARAAGVQVIDGPYADVADPEGFVRTARQSRALGYDGRLVLHPNQVAAANEVFGTTQEAFDQAAGVLDAYAAAVGDGAGAVLVDGVMVDEAVRRMAAVTLEMGKRQGLTS